MRETFSTEVVVDIRGGAQGLGDIDSVDKLTVKWELTFELREWGVKGLSIYVLQELVVTGTHTPEDAEDTVDFELNLGNAVIEGNFTFSGDSRDTLSPDSLELEYSEAQQRWVGVLS